VNTLITLPLDVLASRQQADPSLGEEEENETFTEETQPESDASSMKDPPEPNQNLTMALMQQQHPERHGQEERTMDQIWKELQHQSTVETLRTALDDTDGDVFYDSCSEAQRQPLNSNQSTFDDEEEKEEQGSSSCRVTVTVTASSVPRFRCSSNDKLLYMEPSTSSCIGYNNTRDPRKKESTSIVTKKVLSSLSEFLALWKGLSPSLLLCSNPSIHYTVFDMAKSHLLQSRTKNSSSSSLSLSMMEAFLLGLLAKFCATMATYPLIRAKVMLMVTSRKNTSLLETLQECYQRDGFVNGWFKGCSLQLAHTVLKSALLMMVKEVIAKTTHRMLVSPTPQRPPTSSTTCPL
jgi:Mitochondrial carrier protein